MTIGTDRVKYWIGKSVWETLTESIITYPQIAIITDKNVYRHYQHEIDDLLSRVKLRNCIVKTYIIPAGENSKCYRLLEKCTDWLLQNKFRRECCLVALGGGVVGDLTGLVASVYLRGVDYLQVPTSLLAMVDSSVGGKTAIDTKYGKNTVGSFYYPKQVLTATDFLLTLPTEEWSNGMAEVLKIALVMDISFWKVLTSLSLNKIKLDSGKYSINELAKIVINKIENEMD